jgi:GTP cyclohydrolase IA
MANTRDDNGAGRRAPTRVRHTSPLRAAVAAATKSRKRGTDAASIERRGREDDVAAGRVEVETRDETTLAEADRERSAELEALVRREIELLGEDPTRPTLVKTPARVAKALTWLTRGYGLDARQVIGDALFEESHESMVMVRDIDFYSLCEHHLLPFFGRAHIAYIPRGRIVGLSKLPRVVEVFARRLQVQERLTEQIAGAIESVLKPHGVGVVIEAQHLCMMMRGVEKQNSKTITSAVRGTFRSDAKTRDEFFRLAYGPWPGAR